MEEEILKIVRESNSDIDWHFSQYPRDAAREITSHVMEFINYLLTQTNYPLIFDEINEENTEKYYQYWLTNVKQ